MLPIFAKKTHLLGFDRVFNAPLEKRDHFYAKDCLGKNYFKTSCMSSFIHPRGCKLYIEFESCKLIDEIMSYSTIRVQVKVKMKLKFLRLFYIFFSHMLLFTFALIFHPSNLDGDLAVEYVM